MFVITKVLMLLWYSQLQAAKCPICCWVNKSPLVIPTLPPPPSVDSTSSLPHEPSSPFSPQKKTKGIVHYSDRMSEVSSNPKLTSTSTPKAVLKNSPSKNDHQNFSGDGFNIEKESKVPLDSKSVEKRKTTGKRKITEPLKSERGGVDNPAKKAKGDCMEMSTSGAQRKVVSKGQGKTTVQNPTRSYHHMTRAALASLCTTK